MNLNCVFLLYKTCPVQVRLGYFLFGLSSGAALYTACNVKTCGPLAWSIFRQRSHLKKIIVIGNIKNSSGDSSQPIALTLA